MRSTQRGAALEKCVCVSMCVLVVDERGNILCVRAREEESLCVGTCAYKREYGKVRKEGVDLEGELLFKAVHRNKKKKIEGCTRARDRLFIRLSLEKNRTG